MAADPLEIGSDYLLTLANLVNSSDGTPVTGATVTYALYSTATGLAVVGGSGPMTGVGNNYSAVVDKTVTATLSPGPYFALMVVSAAPDIDRTFRTDVQAQASGETLITADLWQELTGQSVTGADLVACQGVCSAVRKALLRKLRPYLPEPQNAVTFVLDAPPSNTLVLPVRPVRAVTSLYLRYGASGDPSAFTADDLLTPYSDYYGPTDPVDGFNRAGLLYRRGAALWGWEYRYPLGALAPAVDPSRGAVKVVAEVGEAAVPEDVRAAANCAVTVLMNRRREGAAYSSESWNGRSQSVAGPFSAEGALATPEVREFLKQYLTPRFG
jgi:hypothetical protein